jgi:acetyl esterase
MTLDSQVQAMLDQLRTLDLPTHAELGVEGVREMSELAARMGPAPDRVARVEDTTAEGTGGPIPVRVYTPAGTPPFPLVAYFHGGGFVVGSLDTADRMSRRLARRAGCVVVSVGYRLAPEHPFPAGVEDACAATRWVAERGREWGGDPGRLAVAGESAGGNLAAVVALLARDAGGPPLAFQLLVYPVVDMVGDYPSRTENGEGYLLTAEELRWYDGLYLGRAPRRDDLRASPLLAASHAGLPPALVITAEYDPLRDEGEAYAEKLRRAGVPVRASRYPGMVHGFFGMLGLLDGAEVAADEAAAALRAALGTAPPADAVKVVDGPAS